MANKNIDDLPTATSWNAGDKLEILQGGTNKQIEASLLGGITPTLQEVTDVGNTTTNPITIVDGLGNGVVDIGQTYLNVLDSTALAPLLEVDRVNDTVKILGVDVATTDDLNNKENIVSGIAASGTDTYTATYSPTITSYTSGLKVFIKFTNANTTTATINLNSIGAIAIVKGVSTPLASGDIVAGGTYVLYYDGTNFVLLNSVLTNNKTNYSPTWTGITVPPTPTHAYYIEQDEFFIVRVGIGIVTGSGVTRTLTLPFTVTDTQIFSIQVYANGAFLNGSCRVLAGTNELLFYQGIIGTNFVNAQSFSITVSLTFTK